MLHRLLPSLALAFFAVFAPGSALADQAEYTITKLPGAWAVAINERGQVTGGIAGATGIYVYTAGEVTYPDTLGAGYIIVRDINNDGDVAGWYYVVYGDGQPRHAFAWIDGVTKDLGNLDGVDAWSTAIGDHGTVYGQSGGRVFAWRNGHMWDIGGFEDSWTYLMDVNTAGVGVGYALNTESHIRSAFVADRSSRTVLPTLGGQNAAANDINNQGVICGWAEAPNGKPHAFRYQNGKMTDLGLFYRGRYSIANGINSAGDIVGEADDVHGRRAFIVRAGSNVMEDLNKLANSGKYGWKLRQAVGINDKGQIIANGDPGGGYLLTPIPASK